MLIFYWGIQSSEGAGMLLRLRMVTVKKQLRQAMAARIPTPTPIHSASLMSSPPNRNRKPSGALTRGLYFRGAE